MSRRVIGLEYYFWVAVGWVLPHEVPHPWWPDREGLPVGRPTAGTRPLCPS